MNAAAETEDAYLSPPVQRAASLLRHIGNGDRVTNMSQTARALGINRTTLLRLLRTLEAEGFIEADTTRGGWRIGLGLIGLASQAFFSQDMVQAAIPVAERLAGTLGLSAHLAVLDGRDIVFVVRRVPNAALVSNISVGSRLPAHATNLGRIIMANLPPAQVERVYRGQPMQAVTRQTPVTLAALRKRLDQDRAVGLAWSDGFVEPGLASVAAPVFDATGLPVAALNVSGRAEGFGGPGRRETIGAALRVAAEEISRRLGWCPPDFADRPSPSPPLAERACPGPDPGAGVRWSNGGSARAAAAPTSPSPSAPRGGGERIRKEA